MGSSENNQLPFNNLGIKTKDSNGNVIKGLYRTPTGGLVVSDNEAYKRYTKEKKAVQDLLAVRQELEELRETVKLLLKRKENGLN